MLWFGESWGAPVCDPTQHVATPVGDSCTWCLELIEAADQGVRMGAVTLGPAGEHLQETISYHLNCHLRQVFGSVGHQMGYCTCFRPRDDQTYDDPPHLTPRRAADAAVELFELQGFQHRPILMPKDDDDDRDGGVGGDVGD